MPDAGHGHREARVPVREVGGAVERVDAPEVVGARVSRDAAFLAQDRVLREAGADYFQDGFLGGGVGLRDKVGGALEGDGARLVEGGADDLDWLWVGRKGEKKEWKRLRSVDEARDFVIQSQSKKLPFPCSPLLLLPLLSAPPPAARRGGGARATRRSPRRAPRRERRGGEKRKKGRKATTSSSI